MEMKEMIKETSNKNKMVEANKNTILTYFHELIREKHDIKYHRMSVEYDEDSDLIIKVRLFENIGLSSQFCEDLGKLGNYIISVEDNILFITYLLGEGGDWIWLLNTMKYTPTPFSM